MIEPLTPEEAAHLEGQEDRILGMLAEIDNEMYHLDLRMEEQERVAGAARLELEISKAKKSMMIERARVLKTILGRMP